MDVRAIIAPVVGSFQQQLIEAVEQFGQDASSRGFERFVDALKQVADQAMRETLVRSVEASQEPVACLEREGRRYRFKQVQPKAWLTRWGVVSVARRYYQQDQGGAGFAPLDESCAMQEKYLTPDLEEGVAYASALLVPREVERLFEKLLGFGPSTTAIGRVVQEVGAFAEAHQNALDARSAEQAPLVERRAAALVASYDGVSVPVRQKAPRRGRKAERPGVRTTGEGPTAWKEAGVATLSAYGPPQDDKPVRLDTRYWARMPEPHMASLIDALVRGIEQAHPERYGLKALICDGKREIWARADEQPTLRDFIRILDFYHASESLSKAAEALWGKSSASATRWYEHWRLRLAHEPGAVAALLRTMRRRAKALPGRSPRRAVVQGVCRYLHRHRDKMDYPTYRALGLPIGSGVVEAACKNVVAHRLKRSGMRWSLNGGQHVLHLRTWILSNRWDILWQEYRQRAA